MRHWKPDGEATPLRFPRGGKRLRSLDELDALIQPQSFVPPARRRALPPGALAGLILVAAACAGVVLGLYWAAGPRDVFAEELAPIE